MACTSYDFIIIGGGTAGLVAAARLSEDPTQQVLVLEAGSDLSSDPRVKTPALWLSLQNSEADWGFQSEAQPLLNNRVINLNQGKALGGSSAINAQVWVPPVPSIVNYWESHLGNPGWNWEALRPYLSKSFTSPPNNDSLAEVLGIDGWTDKAVSSGPIRTEYAGNASHPIRKIWADTFRSTGHYMANDPFLNASVGSFSSLSSVDPQTKERSTSATAYYHPIISRANLHVLSNATAEKVLLSDQGQGNQPVKATGVLYRHNGELKEVACNKEVVVAAGALQSPKVLELSGIGNSELLKQYGIDTIIDLPGVGENLYDHLLCSFSFAAVDDLETLDAILRQETDAVKEAMEQYTENRTGPLTSMGVYSFAYLPVLEHASTEGHERLVKLLRDNRPAPGNTPDHARAQAFYKMAETSLLDPSQPSCAYLSFISQFVGTFEPNTKSLSISAMHSQPLSRGTVHIQSKDVATKPTVNPNYLSNPVDLEIFAANLLQIETMVRTSPLSTLLKEPLTHRDPASNLTDLEAAKNWIRKNGSSMWHMGGSCAMLPKEMNGVVDKNLKVYGVENLRVVDSSAIPMVSTANLQATVYAFAERAADLIKETYGMK